MMLSRNTLSTTTEIDETWKQEAACAGKSELFFMDEGDQETWKARKQRAVDLCANCAVQAACLEEGLVLISPANQLNYNTAGSIWGGVLFGEHGIATRGQVRQ